MQFVNDDSDDIFRRAGKDYPLKTNTRDWNKIADALHPNSLEKEVKRKNKSWYLLLLLLLPFPWICYNSLSDKTDDKIIALGTNQTTPESSIKTTTVHTTPGINKADRWLDDKKKPEQETGTVQRKKVQLMQKHREASSNSAGRIKEENSLHQFIGKKESLLTTSFSRRNLLTGQKLLLPFELSLRVPILPSQVQTALPAKNSATQIQKKHTKRIYAGLVGGLAATTIRFQKINHAGFDLGLIAGYELSKHWNVETGLLSTQKYYYTKGDQFSTAKMRIPPNTRITSVDGNCRMLEVPFSVQYNFGSSSRLKWFAAAGVSNLFMKQENYDYVYLYTTSGRSVVYSKEYNLSSDHWLSTAQFSGGFKYPLKNIADLRVEPYLQLPLKGVGFGKVPLTTAGIRIGLTKKLF